MDRWIEPQDSRGSWEISGYDPVTNPTGGDPASIFAQLIALFTEGWEGPPGHPLLTIVGTPTLVIPTYNQEPGSGLLALRSAALLNAWDLRGRFNEDDEWVLTYSEPDRALTGPQLVFGPNRQFAFRGLAKNRDEVRNRVAVTPSDPPREPQVVEDPTSQDTYGKKFVGVAEDAASRIRTPAQALALAQGILADTKEPKKTAQLDLHFQPLVEINDVIRLTANNRQFDSNLTLAISGYTHTIDRDGAARTSLSTRDLPAAANAYWRREEPIMEYRSLYPPSGSAAEGAYWTQYKEAGWA
jgi:hypothetical protein